MAGFRLDPAFSNRTVASFSLLSRSPKRLTLIVADSVFCFTSDNMDLLLLRCQLMRTQHIRTKYKGKVFEGDIPVPENLDEVRDLLGLEYAYDCFLRSYLIDQKVTLTGRKRPKKKPKKLVLSTEELSPEQLFVLRQYGILK